MVLCGSRYLKEPEKKYRPLEGELQCIQWALEDTKHFTMGLTPDTFTVETDPKPLLGVFNKDASEYNFNRRIMNLKKKCESWTFQITHIPGKETKGPDCLSRYPQNNNINIDINPVNIDDVMKEQEEDPEIQELKRNLKEKTHATKWPDALKRYKPRRKNLKIDESTDMVCFKTRPLIPKNLRKQMLINMHLGHQGATLMKQIATERCYWPGMIEDIDSYYTRYEKCWEHGNIQPPAIVENSPPPNVH